MRSQIILHQQIETKTFIPVCPHKPTAFPTSGWSEFSIQAANILIATDTEEKDPRAGLPTDGCMQPGLICSYAEETPTGLLVSLTHLNHVSEQMGDSGATRSITSAHSHDGGVNDRDTL